MKNILIVGANGFYGRILFRYLFGLNKFNLINLDIFNPNADNLNFFQGDVLKINLFEVFKSFKFDTVIHLASEIDFSSSDQNSLYENNVHLTRILLDFSLKTGVRKIIFTSSNSIFLGRLSLDINESQPTFPIDLYGQSKVESERILLERSSDIQVNIVRCPIIMDSGRVGILSVLFELVKANSTLWILGSSSVKHDVLYAGDLNLAIEKLILRDISGVFNLSSGEPCSIHDIYEYLIQYSGSKSKIRSLPNFFIYLLKFLYAAKLSPLGPYQLQMLTNNFSFDNRKARLDLEWIPTLNARSLFLIAYTNYVNSIHEQGERSNSGIVRTGLLSLLKYIKF